MNVKKANFWLYIMLGCLVSFTITLPLSSVEAQSVHSVETDGTVGFYGKYIPIGEPNPEPPGESEIDTGNLKPIDRPGTGTLAQGGQKPGGIFPQTGEFIQVYSLWIGLLLIGMVFYSWRKRRIY